MTTPYTKPKLTFPDTKYATEVCKIGQGADCCRYLTKGPSGWSCEKTSPMKPHLDARAAAGTMHARSDNCEGLSSR